VSPGISALQAAAARAGAPLGHDFCTISLSDLLTPWEDIQRRVLAAGEGDFVIAFYNPVSKKRRTQLAWARDELLKHRPAERPVILATNLGREGETGTHRAARRPECRRCRHADRGCRRLVGQPDGRRPETARPGSTHRAAIPGRPGTRMGEAMTVYFIGAGPGAPDLITVRGLRLIERCPVCLYAGSLVPEEIVAAAPEDALVMDTAPMHLDQIIAEMEKAHAAGQDVARVHSGDPSIYGAVAEQMRRLDALGIDYEVVPGVPAFAGAAAKLKTELTLPEIAQTIIVTRTGMKASSMPEGEQLEVLGQSGATLAIHLSIRNLDYVRRALEPYYGADCPVVIAYRATWPDELYIRTTLAGMRDEVRAAQDHPHGADLRRQGVRRGEFRDSDLYNSDFSHVLRWSEAQVSENSGSSAWRFFGSPERTSL
jgi:precorrin-4/cobalt-precorrin-4 C11-methyltransferase